MNFAEAVRYLYGLGNEVLAMKLGLENISRLLMALGNPERSYEKIQIAGTNGKGSTVAFLESIAVAAGIRVGATTSPHLVSVTERVRISGREIAEDEFARIATIVRETSERLVNEGILKTVPTYFEQVTAIALAAFAENEVELAILETGLGGRFDATTAAGAKIVGITPVDLDHQRILGPTAAVIAAEKAAIITPDAQVVVARQPHQDAEQTILGRCREVDVTPRLSAEARVAVSTDGREFDLVTSFAEYKSLRPGLAGRHQIDNAVTAIMLAEVISGRFDIGAESIRRGITNARHPGRLERIGRFLLDGAHNAAGARSLAAYLADNDEVPTVLVFGSMNDKDVSEITGILFPLASEIVLTVPENQRAMSAGKLETMIPPSISGERIHIEPNVTTAIALADSLAPSGTICVTGSLYLVGEVRSILATAKPEHSR